MEFQSKNLSSLLNSNKSIESYLSECTEYEKSNILEEAYNVDEGFGDWLKDKWQGFKHSVSSFTGHGNLQRHGKVFGGEDGGERGEAIDAQMASTESALKDNQIVGKFFQTLKDTYVTNKNGKVIKDYPNIRNESEFQNSTIEMAKLYDSIKAAALGNKQNGQPATIPIQQANVLIRQIRTYIDGLSKQLSDMYQYMTESDLKNYLFEQDEQQQDQGPLKGDYGKTDVMKAHSDYSVPKRLLKWGSILMAAGAAANGASSWMQQLEKWVPQNYDKWVKITQTITNPTDVTSNAHSVWGVWTDTGNQLGTLAPQGGVIKQMGDYQRIAEVLGGGNIPNGVRLMAQSMVTQNGLPKEAVEEMVNVISKANPNDPAGNFANAAAKFGAKNLFRIYKAGTKIHSQGLPQQITKQTKEVWTGMVQTTAGMTGGALALQIAGNALTGAGIALVAGAAVAALMKYKGSKSSRAQLFQVCKDTFKDLNESEIQIPMNSDDGDNKKPNKMQGGGVPAYSNVNKEKQGKPGAPPAGSGVNDNLFRKLGPQALKLFNDVRQNRKKFINAAANGHFKIGKRGKPIKMTPDQANQLIDFIKGSLGADRTGGSTRDAGLAGTVDDHELSYKDPQAKQRSNFIKTLGLNQGDTAKSIGQNAFRKAVRQGSAVNDPTTGKLQKWNVPELGIELTPDQYTKAKALQLAEELKKLKKLKHKILNELNSRTSLINESLKDKNIILKLQKQLKVIELYEQKINEQLTIKRWEKLSGILND